MIPVMAIVGIAEVVGKALIGLGGQTHLIDEDKAGKIMKIAQDALGGVGYAVEAFQKIKDQLRGGKEFVPQLYADLIIEVDKNSVEIDKLTAPTSPTPGSTS